jgi:hypothetical protein
MNLGMGSDFNCDPGPSYGAKRLHHPGFRSRHLAFPKNFTLLAQ